MMNKIRRFCCRTALIGAMTVILPFQSLAATARIAFSDPSATAGNEVSVTMKFTSTDGAVLGNTDVMLSYDAEMLEYINETENASGGAGAIRVWTAPEGKTEMVTQLRFRTLKPGSAKITVTDWEGYDNDGNSLTDVKQGSSSITIEALKTSSDDAKLVSLQVSPGALEPSFSPDVETYTLTVGLDVEKLTVSANPNNEKASVAVEGTDLQSETNTVVCKVTAEDGTTVKNYTITVTKAEGGETLEQPGMEENTEAPVKELEVLAELDVAAKKIRIAAIPEGVEVPSYLKESSIAIGDVRVPGWTSSLEEKPSYCVFYGMNENGDEDFYRYDLRDKTVQRFFQNEAGGAVTQQQYDAVVEEHDQMVDDYNRMMFLTIALAVVCLVLLIILAAVWRSKKALAEEEEFIEKKEKREPKQVRAVSNRKLSKEERYMMGVEDEYEEEDEEYEEESVNDYLPETAEPEKEEAPAAEEEDEDDDDDFEFFDL